MRKIIRGKVYDTQKATRLVSAGGSLHMEELYRKKTEEFFVYVSGEHEKIQPLSDEEAEKWVRLNASGEYDRIFGSEDDNSCAARVRRIRRDSGLGRAEFCRRYKIPIRTVEDWEAGSNSAPEYVIDLLERVVWFDFPKKE